MLRLALWNGRDPILKERLFGLTNSEGNHGEDVKEYYFYLDSTPTHSYMKYLYKYAQRAYTYADIILNNKKRTRNDLEYELIDTGVFDDDRYFDVVLEYAKASADDILIRVTVYNRGPQDASLRLLPTLWYRNTWSSVPGGIKPDMSSFSNSSCPTIYAAHPKLGNYYLACEGADRLLFAENETNSERIFGFSATIRKIRPRTSLLNAFRPVVRGACESQAQYNRNPARCQRTTVSGVTRTSETLQPDHSFLSTTRNSLSREPSRGRGRLA